MKPLAIPPHDMATALTKRELFAAMAMQGLLGDHAYQDMLKTLLEHKAPPATLENIAKIVAAGATEYADALITELEKEKTDG